MKHQKEYLDSLKGIAIIAVTLIHVDGRGLPGILGMIAGEGARGVQMFFVISAILAYDSLERFFKQGIHLKKIGSWLLSKYFRLFPMFYLAISISMITKSWDNYWLGSEGYVTGKNIVSHIFFLHGFFPHYTDSILGVEWYLGVLVIFYFITPFLFCIVNSLEKAIILLLSVQLVVPWINYKISTFFPITSDGYIYNTFTYTFGPLANLYVYCLGIVLYFLLKELKNINFTARKKRTYSYILLLFAIIMIWGQINGNNSLFRLSHYDMFGVWFCIIIISQSLYSCCLIDNAFFRLCGKYSYGIYLFQFIAIRFYERYIHIDFGNPIITKFLVTMILLVLGTHVLNILYDIPIQKKLRKLIYKQ